MASRQPSTGSARKTSKPTARKGTGERDEHYDVISVLYHALQGAETVARYVQDAREASDDELVAFFEETRDEYVARAAQAKQLLAAKLEGSADDSDDSEDEEEEED